LNRLGNANKQISYSYNKQISYSYNKKISYYDANKQISYSYNLSAGVQDLATSNNFECEDVCPDHTCPRASKKSKVVVP